MATNLSELELTLGEVTGAAGDAEQSVTYADRSGDAFQRQSSRARVADALHQLGSRAAAETRFREADQMQTERQPHYPLLYSMSGFEYCDLFLAAPERAAWQVTLNSSFTPHPSSLPACDAVSQRATLMLKIAEDANLSLLTLALDYLTLARAGLYAAILANSEFRARIESDRGRPPSRRSSPRTSPRPPHPRLVFLR